MADMEFIHGAYLAFDVDHIAMNPTGGELVACKRSVKVDDEDLAGAYELIRKLYQEVRIERNKLEQESAELRKLCEDIWNDACHFDDFWDYVHDDGTIYSKDELPHYQERMRKLKVKYSD